jgi:hypothetical protein
MFDHEHRLGLRFGQLALGRGQQREQLRQLLLERFDTSLKFATSWTFGRIGWCVHDTTNQTRRDKIDQDQFSSCERLL